MTKAVLGIIGGSGVYDLPGLENVREQRVESPWGEPSGPLRIGEISGLPVIFLIIFAGLMYFTKKKVWPDVHKHA